MAEEREERKDHEQVRIGDVARRTGLTVRTLRYHWGHLPLAGEEVGLLPASERLAGGHQVYGEDDIRRLHRVNLLSHVGVPLAEIPAALDGPSEQLADVVERHLSVLDWGYLPLAGERLAAMGRLRERVRAVGLSLRVAPDGPDERELVEVMEGLGELDPSITQRLTLLVYDDVEAVHDHLVTVFGFGLGRLPPRVGSGGSRRAAPPQAGGAPSGRRRRVAAPVLGTPRPRLPGGLGVATHCMAAMVGDVDAHYARAVAAGADVVFEPRDEGYGYREYDARDLEGGLWSFMSSLEGDDDG